MQPEQIDSYVGLRQRLNTGDIIFIGGKASWIGKLIKWVTRSEYFHTGVVIVREGRVYISEAYVPAVREVNLSMYSGQKMSVIQDPFNVGDSGKLEGLVKVKVFSHSNAGITAYPLKNLLSIGIKERLGIKIKPSKGMVCSEYVATLFNSVSRSRSIPITPLQVHCSPQRLLEQLKVRGNVVTLEKK